MLTKYEAIGVGISVVCMALALYLLRVETTFLGTLESTPQAAQAQNSVVTVGSGNGAWREALLESADTSGNLKKLVIEDIVIGTGAEVTSGNEVSVHYVGKLQSGEEFDNSNKRGTPFSFTVGEGRVIKGWEEGILGMKVGGQRILVIPADKAYGNRQVGPIPADSTLVFSIELLAIK